MARCECNAPAMLSRKPHEDLEARRPWYTRDRSAYTLAAAGGPATLRLLDENCTVAAGWLCGCEAGAVWLWGCLVAEVWSPPAIFIIGHLVRNAKRQSLGFPLSQSFYGLETCRAAPLIQASCSPTLSHLLPPSISSAASLFLRRDRHEQRLDLG